MESVPHVVHLVISLDHGGLERLVVEWTNGRNRRYPGSTRILCLDAPGDLADQVEGGAVGCLHAQRSRFPWDLGAVARLRDEVRSRTSVVGLPAGNVMPVTILHSHTLAAQQYAVLATRGTGVKHLHTQHGAHVHLQSRLNRWRSRVLCRWTDRIVAVADTAAEAMVRNQKIPRERITVVPNGVAPHPAFPAPALAALRRACGLPEAGFVIGSVGRLDRIKGYDRLLRAFAPLSAQGDSCVLLLVGDGAEREALDRQAHDLGVRGRIVFAGFQRESRQFLDLMDLFVLPSRSEGMSMALLEAMAAGVPVLVTDVGSNRELIANGRASSIQLTRTGREAAP